MDSTISKVHSTLHCSIQDTTCNENNNCQTNGPKLKPLLDQDVYESENKSSQVEKNCFFKRLLTQLGLIKPLVYNKVVDNTTPTGDKKLKAKELENILNEKGIETISLGAREIIGYHGPTNHELNANGNKGMLVKYQGKEYLVSPNHNSRDMSPLEFKEHFLAFLEGNARYSDFNISEKELTKIGNYSDMGFKFKNPFWAVTKGAKMSAIDALADRGIKIIGSVDNNLRFFENDKEGIIEISDLDLFLNLIYKHEDQWLLDLFDGKPVEGAKIVR